jgi:hypothetical protein
VGESGSGKSQCKKLTWPINYSKKKKLLFISFTAFLFGCSNSKKDPQPATSVHYPNVIFLFDIIVLRQHGQHEQALCNKMQSYEFYQKII